MDLRDIDAAERFQRMFVAPMVEMVRLELKPIVSGLQAEIISLKESDRAQSKEITGLKENQKKALLGWAAIVFAVSVGFSYLKMKLTEWLKA